MIELYSTKAKTMSTAALKYEVAYIRDAWDANPGLLEMNIVGSVMYAKHEGYSLELKHREGATVSQTRQEIARRLDK
tara:strand:- start:465 stop:695 length:231 start_codon:yes stop_codon:yes gene_type:complete